MNAKTIITIILILTILITGCKRYIPIVKTVNTITTGTNCPTNAYCEYPEYTNSTIILNYSDINDTIIMRYEV